MLPSLLTVVLFAISAACATQSTRLLGSMRANFWRLVVATLALAAWAHSFGQGLSGRGLSLFLLSGVIGFGVGDVALYLAYPRLGSRSTILLAQCLAAPFGATIEWFWLGTRLTVVQVLWGLCILAGVSLAMAPSHPRSHALRWSSTVGVVCGVIAALGQAGGAVVSRKAFAVTALAGQNVDGLTAAYQRILAGLVFGSVVYFIAVLRSQAMSSASARPNPVEPFFGRSSDRRKAIYWILGNSLAGPALGVGCYQWALSQTPSGIVLPIVALTPLAVIPLAFVIEGERPSFRSILGGIIAVAGTIGLTMVY